MAGDDTVRFEFQTRHTIILAFVVGVFTGGFFISTISAIEIPSIGDGDGPSTVHLQTTDFRFSDVNQGVASGSLNWGNGTVSLEGEPYLGAEDAPVTIVSYEDFECPFCDRYNQNAFPKIVENYVTTGDVKYVYKHLPLTQIHPWAQPAAVAAECAEEQEPEAFWVFKQGFFRNQDALSKAYQADTALFDESMRIWAEQTGLDVQQFQSCYDNQETRSDIQADVEEARQLGATGTPTIFINGQKIVGAQPYSAFEQVINSELS